MSGWPPGRRTPAHQRRYTHLLVAPLHAALALAKAHHVALAVAEHLDLDVARRLHEVLQEHAGVAHRQLPKAARAFHGLGHLALRVAPDDADATTASSGLGQQREADALACLHGCVDVGDEIRAGHDGHAGLVCEGAGLVLEAEQAHGVGTGAHELVTSRGASLCV